jgi:hypothetical protein
MGVPEAGGCASDGTPGIKLASLLASCATLEPGVPDGPFNDLAGETAGRVMVDRNRSESMPGTESSGKFGTRSIIRERS